MSPPPALSGVSLRRSSFSCTVVAQKSMYIDYPHTPRSDLSLCCASLTSTSSSKALRDTQDELRAFCSQGKAQLMYKFMTSAQEGIIRRVLLPSCGALA